MGDDIRVQRVLTEVQQFHDAHSEIKASHGLQHVMAVYEHSRNAIACHVHPPLTPSMSMQVQIASLLHDVDDKKYFPTHTDDENAKEIMNKALVPADSVDIILDMISLVSCSSNGNQVPRYISDAGHYHFLIPRWSDRLEAVGGAGVLRCYKYNRERSLPLSSSFSPRAHCREQVWEYAKPERFIEYQESGGQSRDMISHYYDKAVH